ncbi:helix-turn-helix domain-containing protein [Spirosoma sp. KNUC1025]|uniref:helix-turn-helix domain-containing protein n=1 Tax=Spirosoma sp. KNUC1025 TaxID=2894082 RepID=UPI00386A78FF|nr:helix-turn-helix domain-containing protein [Spirosoma sp. KNUC1025]
MEVTKRIKSVREAKRIKLSEMAAALGVDVSNYAKIEKKGNKLTLERIEQIASALGVSPIEILDQPYAKHLQQTIQELEKENKALKQVIEKYQPVITLVEFMMSNPAKTEELAVKATEGTIEKSDVEKAFPALKEIIEKPTYSTQNKSTK